MAGVAGGQGRAPGSDDPRYLDVTKIHRSPSQPPVCRYFGSMTSCLVLEGKNPPLKIIVQGARKHLFETPSPLASRQ